jgi:two-component system cell cycle response regulator
MRSKLEATPFSWEQQSLSVTASFGVATAVLPDDSAAEILRRADEAMYEAKRNGRNCVVAAPVAASAEPTALRA